MNYMNGYYTSGTATDNNYINGNWVNWYTWKGCNIETSERDQDNVIHIRQTVFDDLIKQPLKEGIEMKNLYEVIGVYGADRNKPMVFRPEVGYVLAADEEDAKLKSGVYGWADSAWDNDYLTILVRNLGAVKIKEKVKEVKSI
jgi:hypothetical protein